MDGSVTNALLTAPQRLLRELCRVRGKIDFPGPPVKSALKNHP